MIDESMDEYTVSILRNCSSDGDINFSTNGFAAGLTIGRWMTENNIKDVTSVNTKVFKSESSIRITIKFKNKHDALLFKLAFSE
jgi:hypothetical protein